MSLIFALGFDTLQQYFLSICVFLGRVLGKGWTPDGSEKWALGQITLSSGLRCSWVGFYLCLPLCKKPQRKQPWVSFHLALHTSKAEAFILAERNRWGRENTVEVKWARRSQGMTAILSIKTSGVSSCDLVGISTFFSPCALVFCGPCHQEELLQWLHKGWQLSLTCRENTDLTDEKEGGKCCPIDSLRCKQKL